MQVYSGKSVFGGIAIGKISVYKKNEQQVKRVRTEDTKGELARYEAAKAAAIEQLQELYQKALKEVGEANAAIFEIHQMMLDDGDYNESVENIIETQKVNAEYAVAVTGDNFAQMFRAMDDDYMRERAADVKDISERVLSVLHGGQKRKVVTDEPVIIVQMIWLRQKPCSWKKIWYFLLSRFTVRSIPILRSSQEPWRSRH